MAFHVFDPLGCGSLFGCQGYRQGCIHALHLGLVTGRIAANDVGVREFYGPTGPEASQSQAFTLLVGPSWLSLPS